MLAKEKITAYIADKSVNLWIRYLIPTTINIDCFSFKVDKYPVQVRFQAEVKLYNDSAITMAKILIII